VKPLNYVSCQINQPKHLKSNLISKYLINGMYMCISIGIHTYEARFWWLKLRALVEMRDWEELEQFARSKKSPIGYLVSKYGFSQCCYIYRWISHLPNNVLKQFSLMKQPNILNVVMPHFVLVYIFVLAISKQQSPVLLPLKVLKCWSK
jgi:hypothetical protein